MRRYFHSANTDEELKLVRTHVKDLIQKTKMNKVYYVITYKGNALSVKDLSKDFISRAYVARSDQFLNSQSHDFYCIGKRTYLGSDNIHLHYVDEFKTSDGYILSEIGIGETVQEAFNNYGKYMFLNRKINEVKLAVDERLRKSEVVQ